MVALKAQVTVRVVLKDKYAVLFCKPVHAAAFFGAHGYARWVLEVRYCVDKFYVFLFVEGFFQRVHIHAVRLHRHAAQVGIERAERIERAYEAWRFADNSVAFIEN